VVSLEFASSDAYTFTLTDNVTGIATTVTAATVDLTSQLSKDNFVDQINEKLADAQANTSVTGKVNPSAAMTAGTLDITDAANFSKLKFAIKLDNGEVKNIDLNQRLNSTAGVTTTAVTQAQIVTAMNTELTNVFDANLTASSTASGTIKLEDDHGRRIEVTQGAGNGFLFGTDVANGGSLLARESARNPMTVAWSGNNLMVTNEAGGKVSLSGYAASAGSAVIFNVVDDAQVDGLNEPIRLAAAGSAASMDAVTVKGKVEPSTMTIRFSDLVGNGTDAKYGFKLTNGKGDTYADLGGSAGNTNQLNVSSSLADRESTIVAAVKNAISLGVTALAAAGDTSFDASEFEVVANGDTISITNTSGRALAIENFSSSAGYIISTPLNEPTSSTIVADRNAYYSETRISLNTGAFGGDYSADATSAFQVTVDGVQSSANLTMSVGTTNLANGAALAAAVQTAIRAAGTAGDVHVGTSSASQTLSSVTVNYSTASGELVIRDSGGRSIGFGYASGNTLATTGVILKEDFVTGNANKGFGVNLTSGVAQGDVYEATKVKLSFSADDAKFDFAINGTYIATGTTTAGTDAQTVQWNADEDFATSTLKTKLDAVMTALNADHPSDVFEYKVSGRDITIWQRDGGAVEISGFKSASTHQDLSVALTPDDGQGTATTLSYRAHTTAQAATAVGTLAVASTATLNLQADDVYSMTLSDGAKSYKMTNTTLDVNDSDSVNNFVKSLENSLAGSSISVSMDTNGNVAFKRADGGDLILTEFTSATGKSATWIPGAGLGDAVSLAGNGAVNPADGTVSAGSTTAATGGSSVAQISIATQDGASKALSVIDKAISYVNTERSKLGAVENRLTHTIDNLANVVTNTSASKSRIKDTDYASETAELARTQIIQQAATAMLAQANQQPQSVLSLLK
jgi:flagellin